MGKRPGNVGPATVIGAKAIHDKTQDDSLKFASTAKLAPIQRPDWVDQPDAFLVGFRGDDHLWTAVVTADGDVVDVTSQSLPDDLPALWSHEDSNE